VVCRGCHPHSLVGGAGGVALGFPSMRCFDLRVCKNCCIAVREVLTIFSVSQAAFQ
jgi:hypothetical protein